MRVVLVCGGRNYQDAQRVYQELAAENPERVVTGGASGADYFAERWAREAGCELNVYHADWRKHGRSAGPKRNQQMLTKAKPTKVLAFPGGNGTTDMVRRAKKAGIPVREVV